jgi:hypothetical protein
LSCCTRGPVPMQVLADELGVTLMHTSARTSEGVEAAFLTLAAQVLGRCVCVLCTLPTSEGCEDARLPVDILMQHCPACFTCGDVCAGAGLARGALHVARGALPWREQSTRDTSSSPHRGHVPCSRVWYYPTQDQESRPNMCALPSTVSISFGRGGVRGGG